MQKFSRRTPLSQFRRLRLRFEQSANTRRS